MQTPHPSKLTFPIPVPPVPGSVTEIAPGIRWLRLPLPYRLDHVNIYLIQDGDGWAALDTGLGTDACRAAWDRVGHADPVDRDATEPESNRQRETGDQDHDMPVAEETGASHGYTGYNGWHDEMVSPFKEAIRAV